MKLIINKKLFDLSIIRWSEAKSVYPRNATDHHITRSQKNKKNPNAPESHSTKTQKDANCYFCLERLPLLAK